MPKQDVTRTREDDDHAAASRKPMLDERANGLRAHDKAGGDLRSSEDVPQHERKGPLSPTRGRNENPAHVPGNGREQGD